MKSSIKDIISCFLAEFIGTAILVFVGCMGCIQYGDIDNNHFQNVFSFGMAVMTVVHIFGCTSGGHVNPAITIAAFVYKLISAQMALIYFVGQMLGGFVGFGLLKALVPEEAIFPNNSTSPGLCTTVPRTDLHPLQALAIEFLATMVIIFVLCSIWDPRNAKHHDSAPLRLGLAVSGTACAVGHFTGASFNPARSFGPALWNLYFTSHWIYWVGPMTAGVITAFIYKFVFHREVKSEDPVPIKEEMNLVSSKN